MKLFWPFCVMVLAGALLGTSYWYRAAASQELAGKMAQQQAVLADLQAAEQNWLRVQQYQHHYAALLRLGVVAGEHRLDWVEALNHVAAEQPDLQLNFSIAPQRIKDGIASEQGQAIYASAMKLHYLASAPRDFFALNERLAHLPGRAQAQQCQLQRVASAIAVDCVYDWLTIAPLKS